MPSKKGAAVRGKFQTRHNQNNMRFESERIETFKTWSKTCPIQPSTLAKAGFYYVGIFDRVKCFSCGGQIEEWQQGETAMREHERMYPHCDMVKNADKNNVTIEKCNELKKKVKSGKEQVDGEVVLEERMLTSDDLVDAHRGTSFPGRFTHAKYPKLMDELKRLDTFQYKWSDGFKMAASETRWLANAGFFKDGPNDRARCFFCGGGIESWEEDDEPWSEHSKNFPTCEWLIEMKGKSFVDEVQTAKATEEAEAKKSQERSAVFSPSPVIQETSTSGSDIASKKVQIMNSPTVKVIMNRPTGCDEGLIRRMVEAQLRGPGLDFSSSDNFIRTLWAAEKQVDSSEQADTIYTQTQRLANLQIAGGPEHIPSQATASMTAHPPRKGPGRKQCMVCKSKDTSTQFCPCTHEVACLQCARVAIECPQCATPIKTYRRISDIL